MVRYFSGRKTACRKTVARPLDTLGRPNIAVGRPLVGTPLSGRKTARYFRGVPYECPNHSDRKTAQGRREGRGGAGREDGRGGAGRDVRET